jgi:hypothetical protein
MLGLILCLRSNPSQSLVAKFLGLERELLLSKCGRLLFVGLMTYRLQREATKNADFFNRVLGVQSVKTVVCMLRAHCSLINARNCD